MINRYISKKVVIAVLIIIVFLIPFIIRVPVKTIRGTYGTYENKIDFDGLYFAEEYVVINGDISNLKIKLKNGEKISKNTQIADGLLAPEAGILIKSLDGYENKYNRNNIKDITINELEKAKDSKEKLHGIKIINNSQWYICAFIKENIEFKKGTFKEINLANGTYSGQIIDVFSKNEGKLIVFRVKDDLDAANMNRAFSGNIIRTKYNGIIIPSEALVKYDNVTGVFLKHNGYAEFKRIEVLFQGKEKAVISTKNEKYSITENDDIILNPKRIKDGMKVK